LKENTKQEKQAQLKKPEFEQEQVYLARPQLKHVKGVSWAIESKDVDLGNIMKED